jgi:hypothetical protein
MNRKLRLIFSFIFIAGSIALLPVLVNKTGKQIERFETKIYQKISGKRPQHVQYDSTGIPVVVYEGKLSKQYNIVTVAEQAISLSDENNIINNRNFYSCIDWLSNNNSILNDSSIIYLNYYNWPSYNMTSPWRSAMNQGRAMQAFLKAYQKSGDSKYLNLARKSMNTLYTEVREGGVTYKDTAGYWYEEYADDSVPESRVLNGMIVVLQALSDFYKITENQDALFLFNKGIKAVKRTLYLYDDNGHSNYDILGKPASPWYHRFHIELLGFIYSETNEPVFNEYKQKWVQYKEPSYLGALIKKPTRIGVFVVFSSFVTVLLIISLVSHFIWFRRKKIEKFNN